MTVEQLVAFHGPNLFYSSVPARQRCCDVRKVRPLERKLETLKAWATGLRRDQAETRAAVPKVDRDRRPDQDLSPGRLERGPASRSTSRSTTSPCTPCTPCGYTSIGCAPCTRAVQPGESERAGRWWWEEDAKKECGIHFAPDGSVARDIVAEAEPKEMHKGFTLWFTGMSGAGKSTISRLLELKLRQFGARVEVLDGDVVRTHLSKGLGFSKEDRDENVRRIGFVCELLARNGVIAVAAAISPYRERSRRSARAHPQFR